MLDPEDDKLAVEFFGDLHFAAGVWLFSIYSARHGITEYVYKFSYDGKLNAMKNMFGVKQKGACHGDDMGYVFNVNYFNKETPDEDDVLFRSKIANMLTNFAKTSNPTPDECKDIGIKWPTFTELTKSYVILDRELTIASDYEPTRMAIFQEMYSKNYKSS